MTSALYLVDDLRNARSELLTACQDVPEEKLRSRPDGEGWSILEVLAHLPDVDRYYLDQARNLLDVPGHTFVYFDDDAWKREHADAIGRDARSVKLDMAAAHDEVVRWAGLLTPEELDRAGGHPRRGSVTVREMVQRIADHDRNHVQQIVSIRRALR